MDLNLSALPLTFLMKIGGPFTADTCWPWVGAQRWDGYGNYAISRGPTVAAHRFAYTLLVGPIPQGLVIDHLCRNRACVNPLHMEPVTRAENTRRGISPSAVNAAKTQCVHGHPFDDANTYRCIDARGNLTRTCRICNRAAVREYLHRKRATA